MTAACCLHNVIMNAYTYGMLKATCSCQIGVALGKLPVMWRTLFCRRRAS